MRKIVDFFKSKEFKSEFELIRKITVIGIVLLIPILFFLYLLSSHDYFFPNLIGSNTCFHLDSFYRYFLIILVLMTIIDLFINHEHFKIHDKFLLIYILFTIISCFFAYDKEIALYGLRSKEEGVFSLLFYVFLYFNVERIGDIKVFKIILYIVFGTIILQFLTSITEVLGWFQNVFPLVNSYNMIFGLTTNSNYLGSLMCMLSMLLIGLFYFSKKKIGFLYLGIFVLSYITLLLTNSLGPFISLVAGLFCFFLFLLIKKVFNWQKFLIIISLCVILYPLVLHNNDDIGRQLVGDVTFVVKKVFGIEIKKEEKVQKTENLGHDRLGLWKKTWKFVKRNPLLGYGPDNIGVLSFETIDGDDTYVAKAHNIYLQIWVSSGIFALIGYLGWIFLLIYKSLKSKNIIVNILGFSIIVYSLQGLFNISAIEVAPYFYLLCGICSFLIVSDSSKERIN